MRKAFGETHTHNTTQKYTTRTNQEFVSLSMKFQASRFSASGRKMPLEPRRSEACRSCQPMHVLSFGEGRKWFVFWVPNKRNPVRVCFPPASPGLGKKVLEYTGPFVGWSRRQNWPPRSLDPDSTHSGYCACFPVLLFFLRVPKRFECFFELGMSCDFGYTLRQCEAEPHLFVDGDSIVFFCMVRNSNSRDNAQAHVPKCDGGVKKNARVGTA